MSKCPHCDAPLSSQDLQTGKCPDCNQVLPSSAETPVQQSDDDFDELVDWDAFDEEAPEDSQKTLSDADVLAEDGQQTISDGDVLADNNQYTLEDSDSQDASFIAGEGTDAAKPPATQPPAAHSPDTPPSAQPTVPDVDEVYDSTDPPRPDSSDDVAAEQVIDRTIESGEFPAVPVVDENQTIPDTADAQNLSEDQADREFDLAGHENSPLLISDDENLTIVDGARAETINADRDFSPTDDQFIGDQVDQTIDSTELQQPIVVDEKRTVSDTPGGQTIEMGDDQLSDSQQAGADLAGQRIEQTLDSHDFTGQPIPPVEPEDKGTGTVHDRATHHTIEVDEDGKPGTVADRSIAATMDSNEFPSAVADRIQHTWQGAAEQDGVSIQTSIKADVDQSDESQTTLVIQRRSFREPEKAPDRPTDYDLLDMLGEGGMGMVYAARQASVDRTVAVKMLKPATAKDRAQRNKFLSEAAVTGDLEHPNIVPIYDLGRNHEGALFYAMKRVQGTPWDEVIREKSIAENLEILMKVADAVAFAHARRVIHRDLKPENVMLGGYGEVLVMDWGLAVAVDKRHIGGIQPQISMGGTPAYMAPEMAAGPFERISIPSDIYLLGAILYEIITGRPPHTGRDVMKCLFAAAKNDIQPTDKSGELVDIALRAMHTHPSKRYRTVQEFQDAIRQYQSHSESIVLGDRAAEHLVEAGETNDYQDFARAMFGFQQAVDLWDGNDKAREGLFETRLEYAKSAKDKGDYDLGASLLDTSIPEHAAIHQEIVTAKQEVDARQRRLKTYKQVGIGMAALFFLVVSGAAFMINQQKKEAVKQKTIAEANEKEAQNQRSLAEKARDDAKREEQRANAAAIEAQQNADEALRQKKLADDAREVALTAKERADQAAEEARRSAAEELRQKNLAETARETAVAQRKRADIEAENARKSAEEALRQQSLAEEARNVAVMQKVRADENAELAIQQKAVAEEKTVEALEAKEAEAYEAYVARIGAAAAKIEENAYDSARQLLTQCIPENDEGRDYRNWEWGRLWYLCNQDEKSFSASEPLQSIAYAPNGRQFVTAGRSGDVFLWDIETGEKQQFNAGKNQVYDVTYSPDGTRIAVAGSDPQAFVRILDAATGDTLQILNGTNGDGHTRDVLSVEFSGDGQRLLTGSYDESAKLWDLQTGRVIQTLHGHSWWVWRAAFCPQQSSSGEPLPETKIVTVSQDGMAIVWMDESGLWQDFNNITRSPRFRGHDGPIYAASFSPDGRYVATGGYDKRVLIWKVSELQEFDFRQATDQFLKTLDAEQPEEQQEVSPPKYRAMVGHTAAIRSLAFTSDGQRIASAGHDNTVRIWDVESGQSLRTLRGHGQWVRGCAISPDDGWVVSASLDGEAKLWNIEGYEEVRVLRGQVLEGHEDSILAASFNSDASQIVTASRDRSLKTWDPATGQEQLDFREGHSFLASSAQFFADGRRLVTAAVDNTTRVWDVATGAELHVLEETGRAAAVTASPDGRHLLTGGPQRTPNNYVAKLWDAETGKLLLELPNHPGQVTAVAISQDGTTLFTGDVNGSGRFWNSQTGQLLRTVRWHGAKIIAAHFLPDNQNILTAAAERTVARCDYTTGKVDESRLLVHPQLISSMAVSADGKHVLTSCQDRQVRLWNLAQQQVVLTMDMAAADETGTVRQVDVTPSGRLALTVNPEAKTVRVWNLETGDEVPFAHTDVRQGPFLRMSDRSILWSARFSPDGQRVVTVGGDQAILWELAQDSAQWQRERMNFSPHGAVASASFSTDGKRIVSGSLDGSARIWDASTGKTVTKLLGHTRAVNSAVFSPDPTSKYVLTAGDDRVAILWAVQSGSATEKLRLKGHRDGVLWASFSADGERIVTASKDSTARIWNAETGELIHELKGHDSQTDVVHADFSPDGTLIVTGGGDNVAIVWNASTGKPLRRLTGHTASITAVAFSPDGSRILTGSEDYTAKLWDAATEKEILTLDGHQQEITSVAFSPVEGRLALTGSHDGTAIVWLSIPWKDQQELLSLNDD